MLVLSEKQVSPAGARSRREARLPEEAGFCLGGDLWPECDGYRLVLVEKRRFHTHGAAGRHHRREALERLLEQDSQLETSQRRAQAEVPAAGAERLVLGV